MLPSDTAPHLEVFPELPMARKISRVVHGIATNYRHWALQGSMDTKLSWKFFVSGRTLGSHIHSGADCVFADDNVEVIDRPGSNLPNCQ